MYKLNTGLYVIMIISWGVLIVFGGFVGYSPNIGITSGQQPLRTITEYNSVEIPQYIVKVSVRENGDLSVNLTLTYHVLSGRKSFGYKQFLLPTKYAYITNVSGHDLVWDKPLRVQLANDGEYTEVGWFFYHTLTSNEQTTISVSFLIVHGVDDLFYKNKIVLLNAGYFGVPVLNMTYHVTFFKILTFYDENKKEYTSDEFQSSIKEKDSPILYTTRFYKDSSYMKSLVVIALVLMDFIVIGLLTRKNYEREHRRGNTLWQITPGIVRYTDFPVSVHAAIKYSIKVAFWATVFKRELFEALEDELEFPLSDLWLHEKLVFSTAKEDYSKIMKTYQERLTTDLIEKGLFDQSGQKTLLLIVITGFGIGYAWSVLPHYSNVTWALGILALILFALQKDLTRLGERVKKSLNEEVLLKDLETECLECFEYVILYAPAQDHEWLTKLSLFMVKDYLKAIEAALKNVESFEKTILGAQYDFKNIFVYSRYDDDDSSFDDFEDSDGCDGCGGCGGCGG